MHEYFRKLGVYLHDELVVHAALQEAHVLIYGAVAALIPPDMYKLVLQFNAGSDEICIV